jgi:hypothetical protein
LLRRRGNAKRYKQTNGDNRFHRCFQRFHLGNDFERIENSREARGESRHQAACFWKLG